MSLTIDTVLNAISASGVVGTAVYWLWRRIKKKLQEQDTARAKSLFTLETNVLRAVDRLSLSLDNHIAEDKSNFQTVHRRIDDVLSILAKPADQKPPRHIVDP